MLDFEKFVPIGGMSSDTDPNFIKDGNYTLNTRNVRAVTDQGATNPSYVPIKGNTLTALIPDTSAQSKIYSVDVNSVNTTTDNQLKFTDPNGFSVSTAAFTITAGNLVTTFNASIKPAIQTALTSIGITSTVVLTSSDSIYGSVIITFTNRLGLDITLTSIGSDELLFGVVQDAIDATLAGPANIINSYDLLGDLFIWSTSQANLPTVLNLPNSNTPMNINTIVGAGTSAVCTTNAYHGLSLYDKITISGSSNDSYNTSFIIIAVPSTTTFTISNNFGNSINGDITLYSTGIGEIGIQTYEPNTDVYTYTRLIQSTQLNFNIWKQIDSYIEQTSVKKSLYWTDDYNVPRVMYYKGAYVEDGFLSYYNDEGQYELDSIDAETTLILSNTNFDYSFEGQDQVGGQLLSGNWRYAFRFLTSSLTTTQWSELSNPVPVFQSNITDNAGSISGDDANVITEKINKFLVTGITPNLFQYIEMAAVNYVGDAIVGYIVSRTLLNSNSSIALNHTGLETGVTTLDLGSLNQIQANYETAKNIAAIDNRLILSNLTTAQSVDFSTWTESWEHGTFKAPIDAVELAGVNLRVGEYNDPNNVYNFVGYMDNEVYRFGARFKMKASGALTQVFWIDDIRFDTSATNITTPNRRIAAFSSYNLTNNSVNIETAYATYVQFLNINLDFNIDGTKARDLIDEIIFERAECVPEILATGMAAMSVTQVAGTPVGSLSDTGIFYRTGPATDSVLYNGEYPFTNGMNDAGTLIPYPSTGTALRTSFSFYSPDILYGQQSIEASSSDVLFNYGNPVLKSNDIGATAGKHYNSVFGNYNGYTNRNSVTAIPVSDLVTLESGEIYNTSPFFYSKTLTTYDPYPIDPSSVVDSQWWYLATPVIKCDGLANASGNTDYGFYYIQYKRPLTYTDPDNCKYGTRVLTKYIPTGTIFHVDNTTTSPTALNEIKVFGGDIFVQKTYVKTRFPAASITYGFDMLGFGGGVGFYSQNRVNSQLNRKYDNTYGNWDYPNTSTVSWLEIEADKIDTVHYNTGYNIKNGINSNNAFDANNVDPNDMPTRIAYSNLKPQNSLVDDYRVFLPLNFKDLDLSAGEIVHHANGNGELLTWQPRKFQRQFFNTRGVLQESNLDILIGDGGVMNRDGVTLSVYGTAHKWSVIRGKGAQGNDAFYWINAELKKVLRFGYDGTVSLSEIKDMESFFANNLTWAGLYDTPAAGKGICGFWDDRFHEAGWTMFGKRTAEDFVFNDIFGLGDVVSYTPSDYTTFEETGELYISLIANNSHNTPDLVPTAWELISHDNPLYYNEYTIIFSEYKNKFTVFYDFMAHIYLKWKDTFFSPRPVPGTQGNIYIHNVGEYGEWYLLDGDSKQADGVLEAVVNKKNSESNWFVALSMETQNQPFRVDFATQDHISFLTESEFTSRMNRWLSPIKQDSTNTGINSGNTTLLFGEYLKVKLTFEQGEYQTFRGFVVKFKSAPRLTTK